MNGLGSEYRTLQDIVYDTLKERILNGDYAQGERLNTYELAEEFGVSRMPVREALTRLSSATGLVNMIPHKGAIVTERSDRDLFEIFHIRAVLESLAAKWACANINEEDIRQLKKINQKIKGLHVGQSEDLFQKYNYEFHSIIWEKANANQLISMLKMLYENSRSYRYISLKIPGRLPEIIKEHEAIIESLIQGNQEELEGIVYRHTKHTYDWLMNQ